MAQMWVYHRTETAKIIEAEEFEKYKLEGWSNTPATFTVPEEISVLEHRRELLKTELLRVETILDKFQYDTLPVAELVAVGAGDPEPDEAPIKRKPGRPRKP